MIRNLVIKELKLISYSLSTYIFMSLFSFTSLYFFFTYLGRYNKLLNLHLSSPISDISKLNLNQGVAEHYFHTIAVLLIFIIPFLSIRLFMVEREGNFLQILLTSSISNFQIIIAKFISYFIYILSLLLISFIFPISICFISDIEVFPLFTGLFGITLVSASFLSLTILFSTLIKSGINAALISFLVILGLYILFPSLNFENNSYLNEAKYFLPLFHLNFFITANPSINSLIYFISFISICIFFSKEFLKFESIRN